MTKGEGKAEVIDLKGLLACDKDFVHAAVEALVQAALENGANQAREISAVLDENNGVRPIILPPRHLKSLMGSIAFPAWCLGHDPRPIDHDLRARPCTVR